MSTEPATLTSGYGDVDRTDDPAKYIRRLDHTGSSGLWQAIKTRMIVLLEVAPGDRILDVGCGTGDDAGVLATLVGPHGQVVGIDRSRTMIVEAAQRASGCLLSPVFCLGDVQNLGFADECFDGCRCERVLQHLDDPKQALTEMVRVTRRNGRVAVVEPDYGTLSIRGADPDVTRRILACRVAHFRSGTIGRQLTTLLRDVGLGDLTVTLLTSEQTETSPGHLDVLQRTYLEPAEEAGVVSIVEGTRWVAQLAQAGEVGEYRFAVTIFLASGRKV